MTPPIKPEVCIVDDRLAVFLGGDYKFLTIPAADKLIRKMQSELARLRRQEAKKGRVVRMDGKHEK